MNIEQLAAEIINSLKTGVIITNDQLIIVFVNKWIEGMSGRPAGSLIGRHIVESFPELREKNRINLYERALRGEIVIVSQRFHRFLFLFPSGVDDPSVPYMLQSVRIVLLRHDKAVVGTVTIVEDVTERVLREKELEEHAKTLSELNIEIQRREEEYRAIVENTSDVIFVLDDNFIITYASPSAKKVFGKKIEDILNTSWIRWLSADEARKILNCFDFLLENQSLVEGISKNVEIKIKKPDREEQFFDVSINLLPGDVEKTKWILVLREVTHKIELERRLKQEREFINKVLQTVDSLVVGLDLEGRIVIFNRACEDLTGYSANEVIGKPIWKLLIPKEEREGVKRVFEELRLEELPNNYENHWITRKGEKRLIRWSNNFITDDAGKPYIIIGTGIDVTEQRLIERELVESKNKLARQIELMHKRNLVLGLLRDLNEAIIISNDEEEIKFALSHYLKDIFQSHSWSLYIMDSERKILKRWLTNQDEQLGKDSTDDWFYAEDCWAIRSYKMYECNFSKSKGFCDRAKALEKTVSICSPISYKTDSIGVLSVSISSEVEEEQLQFWKDVVTMVSRLIGLGFWSFRIRSMLKEQSIIDPLTGVYNRRYLEDYLKIEYHRALRSGTPVAFFMIDIDHFKNVNDRFGHAVGDKVLQIIANLIRETIRLSDVICRYGGEEFLVICPDMDIKVAKVRAEAIRSKIERYLFPSVGKVTVSIGVAVFPRHGDNLEKVIERADEALYEAKGRGRNCTVVINDVDSEENRLVIK